MIEDVVVEPMTEDCILWRCLHAGPLTRHSVDQLSAEGRTELERYRRRNLPLLRKIVRTYGACAILAEGFAENHFPAPAQIEDRTLSVHCLMTGSPRQKENPYQRKGIGTRMVRTLIQWARANGWERIEADSFEDLPIIYEMTGSAGHTFWEQLGFRVVDRHPHPALLDRSEFTEFVTTLEEQAKAVGISPERARDRLIVRHDLT
jgi:hypothetical protein